MRIIEIIEKVSTAFSFYEFIASELNFTAFGEVKNYNFSSYLILLLLGEIIYK